MSGIEARVAGALRAAAEVFLPGPPHDPTPGAADVGADTFIAHYLEFVAPGLATGVADLLDSLAGEGKGFADLALEERARALEGVAEHEVPELRDLPALLGLLAIAAVYGEWSGQDAEGVLVREPLGWEITGFEGPSRGRAHLLREP